MRISIQDTSKVHDPELDTMIRRKVQSLSRYANTLKDAVVEVRHDRHHRKGNVAYVEVTLHLLCHGNLPLRAEETADDVHAALDLALEKLKRQLTTHRDKDTHRETALIRTARGK